MTETNRFAVVTEDGTVVNVIIAENIEIAREVTGMRVLPDLDGRAMMGGTWDGTKFWMPDNLETAVESM
jgi:hypothetical protein